MKVAAYCRVSTDKEDQVNSFESQMRYFREYIERRPDWELYEIYADEGITGTSTKKRQAFLRMLSDARGNKFQKILTKEVSRFARNTVDTLQYTRELKGLGIGVIFVNDGIDTLEADAELRLSIMGSIAQEESRKTSSRVKWGQTRRMEQGVVFGRSLLGYDVKNGKMTINPDGAKLVQLIFHKYVYERKGLTTIARELREAGYRTMRGGVEWHRSVILKILRNEKYCGDLCQKKTITPDYLTHQKKYNHGEEEMVFIKNHHEPIIQRALWEKAQSELERRKTQGIHTCKVIEMDGRKTDKTKESMALAQDWKYQNGVSRRYPLSGKIICADCGKSFVSRRRNVETKSILQKQSYRTWRCGTAVRLGKCHMDMAGNLVGCDLSYQLREDVIEEMVQQSVGQLFKELQIDEGQIINELARVVLEAKNSSQRKWEKEHTKLCQELTQLREKKIKAIDAYLASVIREEDFRIVDWNYGKKIEEIEIRLKKLEGLCVAESEREKEQIAKGMWSVLEYKKAGKVKEDDKKVHIEAGFGNLVENIFVYPNRRVELCLRGLPYIWCYDLR